MALSDWFGNVSLDHAPAASKRLVDELAQMLDRVQPELLDAQNSHAIDSGHGWKLPVEVVLRHRDEPESNVSIGVGVDEAIVAWLSTYLHLFDGPEHGDRPWTTVVADTVAAVLCGEYGVKQTYKRERLVRTKVIDRTDGRIVSTGINLPFWRLIPRRSDHRGPLYLSYACRG